MSLHSCGTYMYKVSCFALSWLNRNLGYAARARTYYSIHVTIHPEQHKKNVLEKHMQDVNSSQWGCGDKADPMQEKRTIREFNVNPALTPVMKLVCMVCW